jgi:D-tyrosyl-tRNA(Tyr) deacylase
VIVVLQRVSAARVEVSEETVAATGTGFLALLGVRKGDGEAEAELLARKTAELRVFNDADGRFNLDILHPDVRGEVLAVSQFTLLADCRKGRRPGFDAAEVPERAEALFHCFVEALRSHGVTVRTGVFGAVMTVLLRNEGPVTIVLDTDRLAPSQSLKESDS